MIADSRYLENLWREYKSNPSAMTPEWRRTFQFIDEMFGDASSDAAASPPPADLIELRHYLRRFGHRHADLDPLGLEAPSPLPLSLRVEGEEAADLRRAYLGTLAIETGHLDGAEIADWVAGAFEDLQRQPAVPDPAVLHQLLCNEAFERFLALKFQGKKRFGSEGADALLPLLHALRRGARAYGADELILGAMHRGRLSVLANFMGMDVAHLFGLLKGEHPYPDARHLPADVPYHLGHVAQLDEVACTLLPNPSHLEAVNALVVGYARARRAEAGARVLPIILHTDGSVIAQGVNAELLQMSALAGFEVGGAIHIIVNNQVSFTTDPHEARTSRYCSGAWRAVDSLLIHANGDDVDAVLRAGALALRFREKFARDVVIDLVCYRANGHNEIDEPRFTQPLYYRAADTKPSVAALYAQKCIAAGVVDAAEAPMMREAFHRQLEAALGSDVRPAVSTIGQRPKHELAPCSAAELADLVSRLSIIQEGTGHAKMIRLMARRTEEIGEGVSWPLAEAMVFARLLQNGLSIRLSGQDVERGSFSHRHLAAVHPQSGARRHILADFAAQGARFEVVNSLLSEYAVLGFEYGFALGASSRGLCIWEAQFGDFANGAQIAVDQFITSGFEKWRQTCNLVVLLPHGLEGQGPEHSSARIERLLQLCAGENIRVAHPSTPANYFHLLCDQAACGDRPLFIITPKVLLRLPEARSALSDFAGENRFTPVLADARSKGARRAILCSGKIAYEVEREPRSDQIVILRLEQLYPFPAEALVAALKRAQVAELVWLQEEPENYGATSWLQPRLAALCAACGVRLDPPIARPASASPAGSFHSVHEKDQRALIVRAVQMEPSHA